jgi:hypothetical protein
MRVSEQEDAHNALDEIGAPRSDGIGMLTLAGRCWALSNKWATEAASYRQEIRQWQELVINPKGLAERTAHLESVIAALRDQIEAIRR